MPGKNRGKKRKTQYCLSYTRRGNQLWQPVCPFLRFLPYTYGEAFRQPFYGALGRFRLSILGQSRKQKMQFPFRRFPARAGRPPATGEMPQRWACSER